MPVDWSAVERIARGEAKKLTRNTADVDDLASAAMVRAVQAVERAPAGEEQKYAAQGARWGVLDEARRLWKDRTTVRRPGGPHLRRDAARAARRAGAAQRRVELEQRLTSVPRACDVLHQLYRFAISQADGSVEKAARALGVGRATLYRIVAAHPDLLATTPAEPEPATRPGSAG